MKHEAMYPVLIQGGCWGLGEVYSQMSATVVVFVNGLDPLTNIQWHLHSQIASKAKYQVKNIRKISVNQFKLRTAVFDIEKC